MNEFEHTTIFDLQRKGCLASYSTLRLSCFSSHCILRFSIHRTRFTLMSNRHLHYTHSLPHEQHSFIKTHGRIADVVPICLTYPRPATEYNPRILCSLCQHGRKAWQTQDLEGPGSPHKLRDRPQAPSFTSASLPSVVQAPGLPPVPAFPVSSWQLSGSWVPPRTPGRTASTPTP